MAQLAPLGKNGSSSPSAVIAIGFAGGGLDALEILLREIAVETGFAIVIAQHVNTSQLDLQCDLIAPLTPFEIKSIDSVGTPILANHVYIMPQLSIAQFDGDLLRAVPEDDPRKRANSIDQLFSALAQQSKLPLAGVILSGKGVDGALGLLSVRNAGGLAIVQSPESAKFDEMPRSAVVSADFALNPENIAAEISQFIFNHNAFRDEAPYVTDYDKIEAILPQICNSIYEATEYEFRHYKTKSLVRRIKRRMSLLRITEPDKYLHRLQHEREEALALFRELLISVTSFFRDESAFTTLAELVLPKLVEYRDEDEPVRIWVPGCATGQEAYSIAMLMHELQDRLGRKIPVQVFATDIDQRALNAARSGEYPLSISEEMTSSRLDRFFHRVGSKYIVKPFLREVCVFSVHNLISDPPFSQMDLISCRNLLIYLGQPLQLKLIPTFHFALRPKGYLFLGPAENLTAHAELFQPIDSKHRISQRKVGPTNAPITNIVDQKGRSKQSVSAHVPSNEIDIHKISQRILLDEFSPSYAVVNENGNLICTSSRLNRFCEFPDGPFATNIFRIVKAGLRSGLRSALQESKSTLRTIVRNDLTLQIDNQLLRIGLTVQPMPQIGQDSNLFMLVFHDNGPVTNRPSPDKTGSNRDNAIEQLELELDQTRSELETFIQDLESSNEELKSSNEELRSLNEELKSANDELEASKEEIQTGVEALGRARSDLQNLLDGTRIATIFLDASGCIKSFTPTVSNIYNVRDNDIGRPLADLTSRTLQMPPIPTLVDFTDETEFIEDEVQTTDDHWFLRRVLPYRLNNRIDGVILTFVDVSEKKRNELTQLAAYSVTQLLTEAESLESVVDEFMDTLRGCVGADAGFLWLRDTKARQLICINSVAHYSSKSLDEFIERSMQMRLEKGIELPGRVWENMSPQWIDDLTNGNQDAENLTQRQQSAVEAEQICAIATPIRTGSRFRGVIEWYFSVMPDRRQDTLNMLMDVGHEMGQFIRRKNLDDRFRGEEARKTAILEAALDCIVTMDMQGRIVDFNAAAENVFGYTKEEVAGEILSDCLIPEEYRHAHLDGIARYLRTGDSEIIGKRIELTALRANGTRFPVELAINVSYGLNGEPFFTAYLRDITERIEKELAESRKERRLAMALNAGKMAAWEWRPNESYWSERLYELLGISHSEPACPETLFNCVHPEDAPALQEAWHRATVGLQPYDHKFRVVHPDGKIQWLAGVGEFVRNEFDEVVQIFGLNWDITDQVVAAQALRDNEAFVRRTIDSLRAIIGVCEPDGTLLQLNKTAAELSPNSVEHMYGQPLWEAHFFAYDHSLQQQLRESIREAAAGNESRYDIQIRVNHDDRMTIDFQIFPLRNDSGVITHLIPSGIDITERKKNQEESTILAKVAEQSTDFVAIMDLDGNIMFLNSAGREICGLPSKSALTTLNITEFVFDDQQARVTKNVQLALTNGQAAAEFEFRHFETQEPIDIHFNVFRIDDPVTGTPFAIGSVSHDIRQRKKWEGELLKSQKAAEAASRAKSEFVANMSHEIRTPMTAVLGYADLLLQKENEQEKLSYLKTIQRNGRFLLEIIDDILDLSKIEAGKLELNYERFSVSEIVRDVHSLMQVRASESDLNFNVEFIGSLPKKIYSDSKRLRQILINLIGNAIKFTPSGSVRLIVQQVEIDGRPKIEFKVIDTGIGISEEQQKKLFQAFSQGDASVSRSFGGTGLGLAISHRLARKLGGTISVDSRINRGSTFICTVSAGDVSGEERERPVLDGEISAVGSSPDPQNGKNFRLDCLVLVVDDRRDVRFLSSRLLTRAGASVEEAIDGVDAIERFENDPKEFQKFDLILLDMQMPRMDGYQTAMRLRQLGFTKPIVALTADAMQSDMNRCLQAGCNAFLSKPIDNVKLIEMVSSFTNNQTGSDSPDSPSSAATE
jgi:two-component system, chemotaxis family, CheB/CheR fusion protein